MVVFGTYLSFRLYGTELGIEDSEGVVSTATGEGMSVQNLNYLQHLLNTLSCRPGRGDREGGGEGLESERLKMDGTPNISMSIHMAKIFLHNCCSYVLTL